MYIYHYQSPLGPMTLGSDGKVLIGLWFDHQKYFGSTLKGETEEKVLPVFLEAAAWLDAYFSGEEPGCIPPIELQGSSFQKEVWDLLLAIPYGQTTTYGELAEKLAIKRGVTRMSAQAVGGAVGHNPISVLVPCHRVVGSGGSLTGYAGGVEKKLRLLQLEKVDTSMFTVPIKATEI